MITRYALFEGSIHTGQTDLPRRHPDRCAPALKIFPRRSRRSRLL